MQTGGRRLLGAKQQRQQQQQTDRQTGGMPTQTVSDEKLCSGEEHAAQETKAFQGMKQCPPVSVCDLRENVQL